MKRERATAVTRLTRLLLGVGICSLVPMWASGCSLGDLFGSDDDDPAGTEARLEFAVEPANVLADETIEPAVEITVLDSAGAINTEFSGSVTVELVGSSGGTLEGTTTREVQNGVAVFSDLAVDEAGSENRLRASADGIESVMSDAFDVIDPEEEPDREPTALEGISGAGQQDTVRATLEPYVVRVTDSEGQPVAGVRVNWEVAEGGGSVTPTSSLTGSDGEATARHTLGAVAGAHPVTAAVEGLDGSPATFEATATHGDPVEFVYTQAPSDAEVNEDITPPVEVTARDQFENTATSWSGAATVSLAENPGGGTLSGTRTRNGDDGVVTFSGLRIDRPGDGYQLRVNAEGLASAVSGPFDVTDDGGSGGPGEPSNITRISGDAQTGPVGEALDADYVVRITDDDGAPVSGVSVTWTVSDGNGSVSPTTSTTNDNGRASTRHTLGVEVGTHAVEAAVSDLTPATFSSTAIPAAASQLAFTVEPRDTEVDESMTPAIEVTAYDQYGNRATSFGGVVTLSIAANAGGGSLQGTRSRAAAAGIAVFPGLSIDAPGSGYRLGAAANGLTGSTSDAFDVTGEGGGGGEPATLARVSGDGQNGTVGEALDADYVVRVLDDDGNPVAGVEVAWTVTQGNGAVSPSSSTTNGNGLAGARHMLGTGVGMHSVEASVDGLAAVTFSATAAAGAASELAFTTQPSNVGIGRPISPAVRVTVLDRFGNTVTDFSGSITVSIRPGSGTPGASLSGTRTRAVSNGVATFDDLSINLIGVGYRLRAAGAGLTTDSNAFNVLL